MSIEKQRAQVVSTIWKAIAQSQVDLSSVPHDQQEQLVSEIADQVMMTVDTLMEDIPDVPPIDYGLEDDQEIVLWEGHPFLSLVESYAITNERLKIVKGMFSRDVENFELIRIQDIDLSQGMHERVMGIGDVNIKGHDASAPEVVLRNVKSPETVYETLRKAWLDARKRHGLQFREYM
jgi:hypothetical protein